MPLTDGPYTSIPHALFVRSLQYGQRGPSLFFAIFLEFLDILFVLCDTEIDRDDKCPISFREYFEIVDIFVVF